MVGESEAGARVKASVIICAHTEERWPYLLEAVASVEAQTHTAHEIIVVIDHNASLYERAVAGIDTARVVSNRDTPGLGGARNSGVEEATGDVVVFLDDDAAASPHWLASFADAYQGADVLGVGGGIVPEWEHEPPPLVSGGIQLDGRVFVPRHADETQRSSESDRLQHVLPARSRRGCGALPPGLQL